MQQQIVAERVLVVDLARVVERRDVIAHIGSCRTLQAKVDKYNFLKQDIKYYALFWRLGSGRAINAHNQEDNSDDSFEDA